jgi:nicotinate-nucleotide pyrophosphorylase (carboxylating)
MRLDLKKCAPIIRLALAEDIGPGDITAALVPNRPVRADIICRGTGVVCGLPLIREVYRRLGRKVSVQRLVPEGGRVRPGRVVARVRGPIRTVLTGERTVLNFLTALSGIATLTRRFVHAVRGTRARIYDTRKTLPGLRHLSKYAVRMGGGAGHRQGLYDMVLLKDNHITNTGMAHAVRRARKRFPGKKIEVEVETLREFREALEAGPDIIMLDNMDAARMRRAVRMSGQMKKRPQIEASGGISLENVRRAARAGVDRISLGCITHSAPVLDISMEIRPD